MFGWLRKRKLNPSLRPSEIIREYALDLVKITIDSNCTSIRIRKNSWTDMYVSKNKARRILVSLLTAKEYGLI